MGSTEKKLIQRAKNRYKKIFPCGNRRTFAECFTKTNDKLCFWFDTEDRSTHVEVEEGFVVIK